MKQIIIILSLLFFMGLELFLYVNYSIKKETKNLIYYNLNELPKKRAVLLLGTAKYVKRGLKNYYYSYRIEATINLWRKNKIKAILVSGDNGTKYYNEPKTMYKDLIKAKIPKKYLTRDYAGFRTLDSVVRAGVIFDLKDYIIVSQEFHLPRALYIAKQKGQKAIGFVAKDIKNTPAYYRMQFREYFARFKAWLDIFILNKEPKFYGKKEIVNYKP